MTLIKSISGIRGTIGGKPGDNLTPLDIVKFSAAFGTWLIQQNKQAKCTVVVGRDARISGPMMDHIICGTLVSLGIDVINIGLAATPTVEIAVTETKSNGGIIITASHNPKQWNALKLLNEKGEFINDTQGRLVLQLAETEQFNFVDVDKLGKVSYRHDFNDIHIQKILELPLVDKDAIAKAGFKVAIDCVNSVGGVVLPQLLKALGVTEVLPLYCNPDGQFPHNPEPLPEHLTEISALVKDKKANLGFVVDPDVDRLAIINEDGSMFGEEYSLVAVSEYILSKTPGNTVSNLSSTQALKDVTVKFGGTYTASAVGEVNVVTAMKQTNAVIGGEGNGGVIYPELHYGRDALVGIALFLTYLAYKKMSCSQLRSTYPSYVISKNKIELKPGIDVDAILANIKDKYKSKPIIDVDGVRINFENQWVHLRKSNTEPIIRIYAESKTMDDANNLAQSIMNDIKAMS
ncbi:MAG TPA: phosphoglucosamine mutase [Bacteroidales bacterium]|nr:phosphoglucosamine mutase [Bacteroidales bacterium]